MSTNDKQYGLVEAKTGKKITVADVFKNTSDSEDDDNSIKKSNQKDEKELKKQVKLEMQRALQDDPTVYQYDEIYDEMTQKKQETELMKKNPEKKPKYIYNLMKTAEKRKKENERRLERQIQKEREAEGDLFKDKEEFITSSYKQKLEEFKMAEEEERKMEYIESVMDVSKQQDLGGFYRHLYKETVLDNELINQKEINDKKSQQLSEPNSKKCLNQNQDAIIQQDNNSKVLKSGSIEKEKKLEPNPSSSSSDSESSSSSSSTSSSSDAEEDKMNRKEIDHKPCQLKSQPKEEEKVESNDKIKKEQEDKSILKISKSLKDDHKSESNYERVKNGSKSLKMDDRERKDRNSRSLYDKGSRNQGRREDRSFRDRNRRDFKVHDRRDRDRRSNDSRRRRSRTPENRRRRRSKSRDRSSERSRSRRDYDRRNREEREIKSNNEPKKNEVIIEKKEPKVVEAQKENEVECSKISIWEKRTVNEVFTAALERYKLRKAARGS